MVACAKIIEELNDTYGDGFSGIGCFKGTFLLQVKKDAKP